MTTNAAPPIQIGQKLYSAPNETGGRYYSFMSGFLENAQGYECEDDLRLYGLVPTSFLDNLGTGKIYIKKEDGDFAEVGTSHLPSNMNGDALGQALLGCFSIKDDVVIDPNFDPEAIVTEIVGGLRLLSAHDEDRNRATELYIAHPNRTLRCDAIHLPQGAPSTIEGCICVRSMGEANQDFPSQKEFGAIYATQDGYLGPTIAIDEGRSETFILPYKAISALLKTTSFKFATPKVLLAQNERNKPELVLLNPIELAALFKADHEAKLLGALEHLDNWSGMIGELSVPDFNEYTEPLLGLDDILHFSNDNVFMMRRIGDSHEVPISDYIQKFRSKNREGLGNVS
ncbi:hypothetical protein V5T82_16950 [Magnetovibrio sp. PR-2]|uniref:hypothetical protein n=1 Tax=Magnetovibrio sp. PR-2 TaxID=3120356 RepID=UPI002FCE090F